MNKVARGGLGLATLAAAVSIALPGTAVTQAEICGPRTAIVEQLGMQFAETQKAIGLLSDEMIMEIYASDHGSWTILTTDVTGLSCLVAAGEAWEETFRRMVGEGV